MKNGVSTHRAGAMELGKSNRRPLISESCGRFLRLPENRSARVACMQWAAAFRQERSAPRAITFLHGPAGTGKSHLAQILVEQVAAIRRNGGGRIVAARDLGKLISGQTVDEAHQVREFRRAALLVVEDVQYLSPSSASAVVAFLDDRASRRLATLFTASTGPMSLQKLPARLTSRFAAGLVVRLKLLAPPSLRRLARFWCVERGVRLSEEVVVWLAGRSRIGPRALFGDLARLQQPGQERPFLMDVETAKRILQVEAVRESQPIDAVAHRVADWFDLTTGQLQLRDRRASLLWPRQIAMYVARRKTGWSLAAIGAYFGDCDHTTVMHALRKVEQRIARDAGLAREIEELLS